MSKGATAAAFVLAMAGTAAALPAGLSGLSFGVGAGALTDGYIQAEFDFMLSPYVCLGPELGMGFGDGGAIFAGAAGRFYVIPDYNYVAQPHMTFGAGIAHQFEDDDTVREEERTGGYISFGAGCDFDIPQSPVTPYLDLGGFFFAGEDSEAEFKIEIGARFNIF
jgi:hypothetical protein